MAAARAVSSTSAKAGLPMVALPMVPLLRRAPLRSPWQWAALMAVPLVTAALLAPPAWAAPPTGMAAEASTRVLDRDGHVLRGYLSADGTESRPLSLGQQSPWLVLATLAAEDQRFWQHQGVDPQAVARAAAQNLQAGRVVSGASTLTQQLARGLRSRPRSWWGKLSEAWRARQIERRYGKAAVLEAYLNGAPYGPKLKGAEAAARAYFGTASAELSLAQAALLAGLPKAPSRLQPWRDPAAAARRRDWVLGRMQAEGWADAEALALARAERLRLRAPQRPFAAPQFADHVRASAPGRSGDLRSTLDSGLQADVQALLKGHLARLSGRRVTNGAVLVLDNRSGEALAWVASADYAEVEGGRIDGVLALRQPGSAVKPFLYALAFSRGRAPSDLIDDLPYTNAGGLAPRNYDRRFHGRVSLRQALACSYNVPAVKLVESLGVEGFYQVLRDFGLRSIDRGAAYYGPALALGTGEVSLLELANAYATLARLGVQKPVRVLLGEPTEAGSRVLDAASCAQALDVLADDQARRPAFGSDSALRLPFPLAAKTGTTKDYRDNWCVGVTPAWTVAVWVGNSDASPMRRVSGVSGAGPLMHDVALRVQQQRPGGSFKIPQGLVRRQVCLATGRAAAPGCGPSAEEWVQARYAAALELSGTALVTARAAETAFSIAFPRDGDVFVLDPSLPASQQGLRFKASPEVAVAGLSWSVDGRPLGYGAEGAWWALQEGRHVVRMSAPDGRTDQASIQVLR